jgi:hypothetical protein
MVHLRPRRSLTREAGRMTKKLTTAMPANTKPAAAAGDQACETGSEAARPTGMLAIVSLGRSGFGLQWGQ